MNVLVLVNRSSPAHTEGERVVLPYLDHFGVPYTVLDLAREPLPPDLADYALVVVAHRLLDPRGTRLGRAGRERLVSAVRAGTGLLSFDPALPAAGELGGVAEGEAAQAETVEFAERVHFITARHAPGETIALLSAMCMPRLSAPRDGILLRAGGQPLVVVAEVGQGRVVQWATLRWANSAVLGPLGGLDDVLWRSLAWAARKPFALRGLAPLVTMRVDDVAGTGGLWGRSPLYWVHTANRHGFKPWLGLFIYNLTQPAVDELRALIQRGQTTAFPHAFGRPPRTADSDFYYHPHALPLRATDYDEFIYFDHHRGRPWPDDEAARGLAAVDEWYAAHAPLPISPYAVPHWGEIGSNVIAHVRDRWGCDLMATYHGLDAPLEGAPWLVAGPFRKYEQPGSALFDGARRGKRPVYYADFVQFADRQFFLCCTEIRDDAGYEWKPDHDVAATVGRGVRQLRRALDSMALPVLFTHETDYIYRIGPEIWAQEIALVAESIREYNPIYVTLDEGIRYVRATRTSRLVACHYDAVTGGIAATFTGYADVPTHFYLFTAPPTPHHPFADPFMTLVEVPAFDGQTVVQVRSRR